LIAKVVNNEVYSEGSQSVQWNIKDVANDGAITSAGAYSYEMIAIPAFSSGKSKTTHFRNILMISK
jgi:hypothetical protein